MDHYIDIKLLPDPEFPATVLMNSLFAKLHKALCDPQSTSIGVSFPNYAHTLGDLLRIHGSAEALDRLQCQNWMGGMSGYCEQSEILPVPSDVKYRTVSRKQPNKSAAKLRRQARRGNLTEQQAEDYLSTMTHAGLKLPYLDLVSGSNGHRHRRYIELGGIVESSRSGAFDQFGLSKTATIPWF